MVAPDNVRECDASVSAKDCVTCTTPKSRWKTEVSRLEEELGQLRSTAAWALPLLSHVSKTSEEQALQAWPRHPHSCDPLLMSHSGAAPRVVDFSVHSTTSLEGDHHMMIRGQLDDLAIRCGRNGRGRSRNTKITPNTVVSAPSPRPQVVCGGCDEAPHGYGLGEEDVDSVADKSAGERTLSPTLSDKPEQTPEVDVVGSKQSCQASLQKAQQEKEILQEEVEKQQLDLERLRSESIVLDEDKTRQQVIIEEMQNEAALLQEENTQTKARLEAAKKEIAALQEDRALQEESTARDMGALEAMLEPVMAENERLKAALKALELQVRTKAAASCDAEQQTDEQNTDDPVHSTQPRPMEQPSPVEYVGCDAEQQAGGGEFLERESAVELQVDEFVPCTSSTQAMALLSSSPSSSETLEDQDANATMMDSNPEALPLQCSKMLEMDHSLSTCVTDLEIARESDSEPADLDPVVEYCRRVCVGLLLKQHRKAQILNAKIAAWLAENAPVLAHHDTTGEATQQECSV